MELPNVYHFLPKCCHRNILIQITELAQKHDSLAVVVVSMLYTVCKKFSYYWNGYLTECHLSCMVFVNTLTKYNISISTIFPHS